MTHLIFVDSGLSNVDVFQQKCPVLLLKCFSWFVCALEQFA